MPKQPATANAPRQAPLESNALRAALLDGVRFWCLATGSPPLGNQVDLVDHQLAAIRRACQRTDPLGVRTKAPPMQLAPAEPAEPEQRPLPWWNRD